MNIPELIKKIKEAHECFYSNDEAEGSALLNEVIRELEQQIDDGK